jgi:hypothetical protein
MKGGLEGGAEDGNGDGPRGELEGGSENGSGEGGSGLDLRDATCCDCKLSRSICSLTILSV